jgi:hypothetical protein
MNFAPPIPKNKTGFLIKHVLCSELVQSPTTGIFWSSVTKAWVVSQRWRDSAHDFFIEILRMFWLSSSLFCETNRLRQRFEYVCMCFQCFCRNDNTLIAVCINNWHPFHCIAFKLYGYVLAGNGSADTIQLGVPSFCMFLRLCGLIRHDLFLHTRLS